MDQQSVPSLLKIFIDGITKASGAAAAIVHEHQDPRFIAMKDYLIALREKSIKIAMIASGVEAHHVQH